MTTILSALTLASAAGVNAYATLLILGLCVRYDLVPLQSSAAQFFAHTDRELGGLADQFAQGQFEPLRNWLGERIHQQGQRYSAAELVERVTGEPLSPEPLIKHLRSKLGPLYGI